MTWARRRPLEDRARTHRWRTRALTAQSALPGRSWLVRPSGRIGQKRTTERARRQPPGPTRPWRVPGVHVDAVGEARPATPRRRGCRQPGSPYGSLNTATAAPASIYMYAHSLWTEDDAVVHPRRRRRHGRATKVCLHKLGQHARGRHRPLVSAARLNGHSVTLEARLVARPFALGVPNRPEPPSAP